MHSVGLIDSFSEFKEFKNIDRATMQRVLEDVFRSMLRKKYGTDENFSVIINDNSGDLEIWQNQTIVPDGEVEESRSQISLADAHKIEPDFEVNEEVTTEITLESFGRRAILAARQTLMSKVLELEKDELYKKYKDRVGEIVIGEVYQVWKKELMVLDDEGNELLLPKSEMIPADHYKKGDSLKCVVLKVEMYNGSPRIILSRTSGVFLERLFEQEVPEIIDGLINYQEDCTRTGRKSQGSSRII
jgi:N utilization substance protein A